MNQKSPFECLYNTRPDYSLLKVFGCLCYASIHGPDKFDSRVIRSVFLRYPNDHRGYKLLNLDSKQLFVTRHVVFHETVFPYCDNTHTKSKSDPYFLSHWVSDNVDNIDNVTTRPINTTFSADDLPSQSITSFSDAYSGDDSMVSPAHDMTSPIQDSIVGFSDMWQDLPPDCDTLVNLEPQADLAASSTDHFLRKSTRERKRPAWWTDFQCPTDSVKYPMVNFVSTHFFSTEHAAFMSQLVKLKEPTSFAQAITDSKWVDSMNKELDALESNNTWILVPLPKGKKQSVVSGFIRSNTMLMVILIVIKHVWLQKGLLKSLELISRILSLMWLKALLLKQSWLLLLLKTGQFFSWI